MENYLEDVLELLIKEAFKLKESSQDEFEVGQLFGLYRAISVLLNQAEVFGIAEKLPLEIRDFNPESLIDKSC